MIKNNYLVEKRNILNELRTNNMTLQELRFFSIYLSRINARDINTRVVKFYLDDFKKIMELGKINVQNIKTAVDSLLCKVVHIPNEDGGFSAFQLFSECTLKKEGDDWVVEIDAHNKALPLMFDFKEKYFSYSLWNALNLSSKNQLRMYEILKQYEKAGERTISVDKLKELLGIAEHEYNLYNNFKRKVLDACQEALAENTDIKFTYEPHGKKGRGGKILELKFKISKNKDFKNPLKLDEFIDCQYEEEKAVSQNQKEEKQEINPMEIEFKNEQMRLYSDASNNEFTEEEVVVLFNTASKIYVEDNNVNMGNDQLKTFHIIKDKYDYMHMQSQKRELKNRFAYLKKLLELELED